MKEAFEDFEVALWDWAIDHPELVRHPDIFAATIQEDMGLDDLHNEN